MQTTPTHIEAVTVYSDRAQVQRRGRVALQAGINCIRIGQLSPLLQTNSLQATVHGQALLRELKNWDTEPDTPTEPAELAELRAHLAQEERQQASLRDDKTRFERQQQFNNQLLDALAQRPSTEHTTPLRPEVWAEWMDFYGNHQSKLQVQLRETNLAIDDLSKTIGERRKKIDQLGAQHRAQYKGVELWVESPEAEEVDFDLSYLVGKASWQPQYDLKIVPNEHRIELNYNALVRQNTEEDWTDVRLHLSTAKVSEKGFPPKVKPQRIWLDDTNYSLREREEDEAIPPPAPSVARSDASADLMMKKRSGAPTLEPRRPEEELNNFLATVNFDASEKTSILSQPNDLKKVTILKLDFAVAFRYTTVPKLSDFVYLKAQLTNHSAYPLLAGACNVFLGNSFVTQTRMELTHPNEQKWVFLGVDERVKVERKLVRKEIAQGGFMKKNNVRLQFRIELTNTQAQDIAIGVWEPIPLSENKNLLVELHQPKLPKNAENPKLTDDNALEWNLTLAARQKTELIVEYTIEYPLQQYLRGIDLDAIN